MDYHKPLILLIFGMCLLCGCSSTPAQTQESIIDEGLTDVTMVFPREKAGLEDVMAELDLLEAEGLVSSGNISIFQIYGAGLDAGGNATSWVLGIRDQDVPSLFVYNERGWRQMEWIGPMPETSIDVEGIVMPSELYRKHHDILLESGGSESDLALGDNVYTVNIQTGARVTVLHFSAETGELITSV